MAILQNLILQNMKNTKFKNGWENNIIDVNDIPKLERII